LQIDYNGAGTQTVNNAPAYSRLQISGSGTKTLQGNTVITSNLNIVAGTDLTATVSKSGDTATVTLDAGGNAPNSRASAHHGEGKV